MSDEIKLDKGIPLPPKGRVTKFPWAQMEVGDSFVFPSDKAGPPYLAAKNATKRYAPKTFIHGKRGSEYRVWRTA